MPIFGGPSPLEADIEKATNESLISENWPLIFEICDKVKNSGESGAKDCVKAILKRLQNKNPRVVYYTLVLLEACATNCGKPFLLHISSREFCQEIQNLINGKNSAEQQGQPKIRNKVLFLIKSWNDSYKDDPQFALLVDLYRKLKDRPDVDFPTETAPGMNDQFSPSAPAAPPSQQNSTASKEEDDIAKAIALSLMAESKTKKSTFTSPVASNNASSLYGNISNSVPAASSGVAKESRKVRALYDFEAAEDNELTFKTGEIVILIDDSDQNWWKGENHRGQGFFPAHFVSFNLDSVVDASVTASTTSTGGTPRVGFQEEVKVIEYTPATSTVQYGNQQPAIDENKIKSALEFLHNGDPTGESAEPQHMIDAEADCYAMGPMIDTELENIDREHLQLTELNKKLMDAFSLYNKLMKQAPVVSYNQQLPGQPAPSFNQYLPQSAQFQQPVNPSQPTGHIPNMALPPSAAGYGGHQPGSFGSYPPPGSMQPQNMPGAMQPPSMQMNPGQLPPNASGTMPGMPVIGSQHGSMQHAPKGAEFAYLPPGTANPGQQHMQQNPYSNMQPPQQQQQPLSSQFQ